MSAQTYWAAYGLAQRGHQVFVVTNAAEVEDAYRVRLDEQDGPRLATTFPETGGELHVFRPEAPGYRMEHIPWSNPHVSKLAGLATDVVRAHNCELIIGSYFEPYAVSAFLASTWTGVPFVAQHAGSDLDRLMDVPELSTTYREMLCAAKAIVTRPSVYARFEAMGIPRDRLLTGAPYETPALFNPEAEPLDSEFLDDIAYPRLSGLFDKSRPTLGMYGKPGLYKGSFDFIAAAGILKKQGADFNILLMSGSSRLDALDAAIGEADIADRTKVLPFLPHWRVPSFIRTCTAVAFLERDFPVAIHGPVLAREILASGTALLLSGEIHAKQNFRDELVDGENFLLVPDPKERDVLAAQMGAVVHDPERARRIGIAGAATAVRPENNGAFVDAWERIIDVGIGARTATDVRGVYTIARPRWLTTLREAVGSDSDLHEILAADDADTPLVQVLSASKDPVVVDAVRFLRARHRAIEAPIAARPITNVLASQRATVDNTAALAPYRAVDMWIEQFSYDVLALFCQTDREFDAQLLPQPITVCFAKKVNCAIVELQVSPGVLALLEACDGQRVTSELIPAVLADVGATSATAHTSAHGSLLRLHRSGYLGFTHPGSGARALISAVSAPPVPVGS
ncbi:MAG: glycosyltransferase [Rhodococcus sp.]|nr:glycosyltransferase [Rhodococcus sp. (in: high G+C Gram-positive bacteria)]